MPALERSTDPAIKRGPGGPSLPHDIVGIYSCREFPTMDSCAAEFTTEVKEELCKVIERHASVAHRENPAEWPEEHVAQFNTLIRHG